MNNTIVISNMNTGEYFFSTDHCQDHGLGSEFVPITHYKLTKEEIRRIHYTGNVWTNNDSPLYHEIPNPDPNYQA